MSAYIAWFLLALTLLAAEMATGTFYLLVLAIALGMGGVAALFDMSLPMQLSVCAVVGVVGTIILRRSKVTRSGSAENQNLDIGQPVQVIDWREDGTLRVRYRGTEWDAEVASGTPQRDQSLYITAMHGSTLILDHHNPRH